MTTYVDMNYDGDDIIKIISSIPANMISRNTAKNLFTFNVEYIITAGTSNDFIEKFPRLMKEPRSNSYALFLIIVKSLKTKELRKIFDAIHKFYVHNVLLVNGTDEVELFTYNAFDNYNCGKKYDDIIKLGKCLNSSVKDLYPYKLVTGLQNCTFKATIAHWPPYAIDPAKSNDSIMGLEQYVFQVIGELEGFKVKYTESIDGEEFFTIGDNKTSENLLMLQTLQTDFIFGGMLLVDLRADVFNFIWGHLAYMDDIRIFVEKAKPVALWKNLILEFDSTVWLMLIVTFLCYFLLLLVILRVKDITSLFLVMLDFIFLHGNRMVAKSRRIFIFWIIFAYLINTYYQSTLLSFTSNPVVNYQISTTDDLTNYKIEPCISEEIQMFFLTTRTQYWVQMNQSKSCTDLMESMRSVSRTNKKFTVFIYSIYRYNKYLFYNERGEDPIYPFKDPINRVIYAIYFHKGFPLQKKLNLHTIRLRENGIIDRYLHLLYYRREKHFLKTASNVTVHSLRLLSPWYILLTGYIAAFGLFLLEMFSKKIRVTYPDGDLNHLR